MTPQHTVDLVTNIVQIPTEVQIRQHFEERSTRPDLWAIGPSDFNDLATLRTHNQKLVDLVIDVVIRNAPKWRPGLKLRSKNHYQPLIVDVGCGIGALTIPLALNGYRIIGADISRGMIKRARQAAEVSRCVTNIKFILANATNLVGRDQQLQRERISVVIMGRLGIHVLDSSQWVEAISQAVTLIERGGTLIVYEPMIEHNPRYNQVTGLLPGFKNRFTVIRSETDYPYYSALTLVERWHLTVCNEIYTVLVLRKPL